MQPQRSIKSLLTESLLWVMASAVGVLVPTGTAHFIFHRLLEKPALQVSLILSATVLLSLTWGSWSGLVWAKNRLIRAGMRTMTLLPGLLLVFFGLALVSTGRGSIISWALLFSTGLSTLAVSFLLSHKVAVTPASTSGSRFFAGMGVFPFMATLGGGSVFYLWLSFLSNPIQRDWKAIFSIAFFFLTMLAMVLITTVIPALATVLCRQLVAPRD